MSAMTATYSPDDNKLRLHAETRLDAETYARVSAAGFKWAPKQGIFVAPMWTPEREDVLLDLCGEVGDDDMSLVERAEERADRFSDYSDSRAEDARAARQSVAAIMDGIPFGQPILVGHHSEGRARRDAKRIETGMRRTVRMWETADYWKARAQGALRHARYKEMPAVRHRRIKRLEAELRGVQKTKTVAETLIRLWSQELTEQAALQITNRYDHTSHAFPLADYPRPQGASTYEGSISLWSALRDRIATIDQIREIALAAHRNSVERAARWISHYENRLAYERAMLDETGGTVADRKPPEKGGGCRCWASPRNGWSYVEKVNKVSVTIRDTAGYGGRTFTRTIPFDALTATMSAAEVEEARAAGTLINSSDGSAFFLSDAPPPAAKVAEPAEAAAEAADIDAMRKSLAEGVQAIQVPQLVPTPPALADFVVSLARIERGHRLLEPNGGSGALLDAVERADIVADITTVEIHQQLAEGLRHRFPDARVHHADFLDGNFGLFDRIIMNPPFSGLADIEHVRHAFGMLAEGGRLVAIMGEGAFFRQDHKAQDFRQWLDSIGGTSELLAPGSFADSGTNVSARIVLIDA